MGTDDRTRAFERALLDMDRVRARETLLAAADGTDDRLAVAESVVAPALERIGDDWEQGTVSLAQLYMAGRIAEQIVSEVLPQVRPSDGETPDVAIAGRACELSLSLGAAAFYPAAPCTLDEVLHVADTRMYAAKQARKVARAGLGEAPRAGGPEGADPGGAGTQGPAAPTR